MNDRDEYDVLDSLLDSINNDDTMEKKINDFARTKQRKKRIERARETSADFQSKFSTEARQKEREERMNDLLSPSWKGVPVESESHSSLDPEEAGGSTRVVSSSLQRSSNNQNEQSSGQAQAADPGDGTIVFKKAKPVNESEAGIERTRVINLEDEGDDSTVYMNEDEIQNLLEQDEPILKREYIRSDQGSYDAEPERYSSRYSGSPDGGGYGPKKVSWKLPVTVFGVILGAFLIYGGFQFFTNYFSNLDTEKIEERKRLFDQVMDWAEKYDTYSEEDQKKIAEFEKMFNKLDDEQKRKINEVLMSMTGKNFDELLALAKSDKKQDSNSNMTQIAEKKGELKQKIEDLKGSIAKKQEEYNEQVRKINAAYQAWQDAIADYDKATENYNNANVPVNNTDRINELASALTELNTQLSDLQGKLSNLENTPGDDEDDNEDEDNPGNNQTEINDLKSQIQAVQDKINENKNEQNRLTEEMNTPNPDAAYFKGIMDSAKLTMDQKKDEYDQINGSDAPIKSDLDALNSQLAEYQRELESLD